MSGSTHTLQTNLLPGFFNQENYNLISYWCTKTLEKIYNNKIVLTPSSIAIECQNVYDERIEAIPKMNQRVVMNLVRAVRNEMDDIERKNYFMDSYRDSYNYDPILGIKPYETPKLNYNARAFKFHFTF